jgi:hypothetical protein
MHIVFGIITAIVLITPLLISIKLLIAVIVYNTMLPLWAKFRDHPEWLEIWMFVFPISLLMVFPDWFLASQLETIVFPIDGFPMIGSVPIYMAGLWTIPLFLIIYIGLQVQKKENQPLTYLSIIIASLAIFGGSEETLWLLPSWSAQNVAMISHIAIYIIIPEIILGLSAFILFISLRDRKWWEKLLSSFVIMLLYIGAAGFFYFVIERLILGV